MFKRIMLTLTFAAAFGAAGLSLTDKADAHRGWYRPYAAYYGPPAYYTPYRAYYGGYYAPRAYYSYGYPGYFYRSVPRVAVRVGW